MSTLEETDQAVSWMREENAEFALLHCNSTYPAPLKDINLNYIKNLEKYNVPVGYSGHERGIATSLGAVAIGAKIIERHITLDRNMEGPDHAASLEFDDFNGYCITYCNDSNGCSGKLPDNLTTLAELEILELRDGIENLEINRENLDQFINNVAARNAID